jgi:hypothetical protein
VRELARRMPDKRIARLLNRAGKPTGRGNGWTGVRVRSFRHHHISADGCHRSVKHQSADGCRLLAASPHSIFTFPDLRGHKPEGLIATRADSQKVTFQRDSTDDTHPSELG